jgi:hypothetical protein
MTHKNVVHWHGAFTSSSSHASACHHIFPSRPTPLDLLVVRFSGASASPSRCTSARHLASAIHNTSTFCCTPLVWLVVTLSGASTPPSRRNSARCRLSSHPSRSVGLSHCPAPRLIVQMVVILPLLTAPCVSTPLVCDSLCHRLPLLPQPYPSRTMSPFPERERGLPTHHHFCYRRGARPSPARGLPHHCHHHTHLSPGRGPEEGVSPNR